MVDLTLSPSPSPPRRRPYPHPQPLPPLKTEFPTPRRPARPLPAVPAPAPAPAPAPVRINPDHLRRIIDSSDPKKVADLLFDLCIMSPALSGAVARGLAPQSSWARATIRDYRRRVGLPAHERSLDPSPEPRSDARPRIKSERIKSEIISLESDSDHDVPSHHIEPSSSSRYSSRRRISPRPPHKTTSRNPINTSRVGLGSTPHQQKPRSRSPTLSPLVMSDLEFGETDKSEDDLPEANSPSKRHRIIPNRPL